MTETIVAATTDVETTEVDVSIAMIVEVDLTETIEADDLNAMTVETTAVIGIAPSATTIISLSGMNATDAVSQEETVVAAQTTEDSNAETTDVVATDLVEMTDVVATEEVAMTDVAMTVVVATADRHAVNLVNNANPENSERLVERDQAMLTTDHLEI